MLADAPWSLHSAVEPPRPEAAQAHPYRGAGRLSLSVHPHGADQRAGVEAFICEVYRACYRAHLRTLAPTLVALRSGDEIVAAAGYRSARQALFLERYLHAPVEQCLYQASGHAPPRARVVEVGHLASTRNGAGRLLMPLLGAHLAAEGYEWVVSTATEELHHLFRRLGLTPLVLGTADPGALGRDAADWGSYYEHHPRVLAGNIASGMARLARGRK